MIVEPRAGDSPAQTAEAALWAILTRRLESEGAHDALEYLRDEAMARVEEESFDGALVRVRLSLHQRLSDYSASYNARSSEQMSWFFAALMEGAQPGHRADECLETARTTANPPPDAELQIAEIELQADSAVFVARWRHLVDGIEVERDYIQVLVNPRTNKVFAFHRKWHELTEEATER
jgi:hypothetical protein